MWSLIAYVTFVTFGQGAAKPTRLDWKLNIEPSQCLLNMGWQYASAASAALPD